MAENTPPTPSWPPKRSRKAPSTGTQTSSLPFPRSASPPHSAAVPSTPRRSTANVEPTPASWATPSPLANSLNRKKQYRNGYETAPKTPQFKPYALQTGSSGRKRLRAFSSELTSQLVPQPALSLERWNELAREARLIPESGTLKDFQVQCANYVISRSKDICVVAPTGAGKSLLWCLPLLASQVAVSLVVTPYTSLGCEGEQRMLAVGLPAVFVNRTQKGADILEAIASGLYRVVFICAEMLETPSFARVLHSPTFQSLLCGLFIDEAHLVHESHDWRTAYTRLRHVRSVIGLDTPLIAMSATLPSTYRASLCLFAGMQSDYYLINLGNHRPELATVVLPLEHEPSSFQDLAWTLPFGVRRDDIPQTIIYCDNLDMLTKMFWWYHARLSAMDLPPGLVDILHAGLSGLHEERALADFRSGLTKFLLGSEKIGAGINFPKIQRVVQYLCRRALTVAKFDQRRGRGARSPGMTAVGYLLVEANLLDPDYHNETSDPVDAGILTLITTRGCYQDVLDASLENPPRPPAATSPSFLCCSNCHPSLKPTRELRWIMVNFDDHLNAADRAAPLSAEERNAVFCELERERLATWRADWRERWPSFGPKSLIADTDLENVAKHAASVRSLDDLEPLTQLAYWEELAPWLLTATQAALTKVCGGDESPEVRPCSHTK